MKDNHISCIDIASKKPLFKSTIAIGSVNNLPAFQTLTIKEIYDRKAKYNSIKYGHLDLENEPIFLNNDVYIFLFQNYDNKAFKLVGLIDYFQGEDVNATFLEIIANDDDVIN